MKLKKSFGFIVMAVAMLGLSSTLSSMSHAETKVGFVYVGPIGDHGWTYPVSYTHLTLPTICSV